MPRWRTTRSWLRSLLAGSQVDREIDDELQFHLEEETKAAMRDGVSPDEARRAARTSLGGPPALIREQCRDERGATLLDDFARDLGHGARVLRRNPGFTAAVGATLAVAIAATVTVFSITDAWLLRPLSFPDPARLVVAFGALPARPTEPQVWMPYRAYLGWQERSRSFASLSAAFVRDAMVTKEADGQTVMGLNVTAEFFRTLGVGPLLGRTLTDRDVTGARTVVLSYGFWQRYFGGSRAVIGTPIALSGVAHEIVGVMPPDFDVRVLDMRFEFWTVFPPGDRAYGPGGLGPVVLVGRLRDGVTVAAAQAEVAAITRDIESGYRVNFTQFLVAITSLQADNTRTVRATLLTVSAAVGGLLLIASMNVGALLLGRGLGRTREVAIRVAVGAGRMRLVRQLVTESLLLVTLGGCAGLGLAVAGLQLFVAWSPLGALPPHPIQLDVRVMAIAAAVMVVTTAVCGLGPALRLSHAAPHDMLLGAGGARGAIGIPAQRAQAFLLAAQTAMCVVLLVTTTLLSQTFATLHAEPLGFASPNLFVAGVTLPTAAFDSSERRYAYYTALADRVRAIPGVRAVAAGTSRPLSSGGPTVVNTGADDAPTAPRISTQDVTPEFFEALGIPSVAGRPFDQRDAADGAPAVILNVRAARDLFGSATSAIGRRVRLDSEPWREVVGVVGDVRSTFFNTLEWRTDPIVYRPAAQAFSTLTSPAATSFGFHLHVRADRSLSADEVRRVVRFADPRALFTGLDTASRLIDEATRQPLFRMRLLSWFAGLSLLLAAVGIYALVSQAVNQRTRELAVRLVLGATRGTVMMSVARRAIETTGAGLAIGAIVAYVLGGNLRSLLYGVQPRDAMSFLVPAVALAAVSALAAFVPARRVTRIDPAQALRAE